MSGIFGRWGRHRETSGPDGASSGTSSSTGATPPATTTIPASAPMSAAPTSESNGAGATPGATPGASNGANATPAASAGTTTPAAPALHSTMMDYPLTLQHTMERVARLFPHRELVTNTTSGLVRTTYGEWAGRVRRLTAVLDRLGVKRGDRVGTLGWNTTAHQELYFAAPCMGAVLHTLNLRLFPQDLAFIINDAADGVIFVDADLLPLLEKIADQLTPVRTLVVMNGTAQPTEGVKLPTILNYEELLAEAPATYDWPALDERAPAAMCYTSGTTGNPKGVIYSHRSIMLHSLAVLQADSLALSERDRVMPVVPMFHANAWGLCHAAPLAGASLVFPGRLMDAPSITRLMADEHVTIAAGVPTIWIGLMQLLDKDPGAYDLSALRSIPCGGSAAPRSLIEGLERHGLHLLHAWGMTETSPLASVSYTRSELAGGSQDTIFAHRAKQGIVLPLVDLRIVDDDGHEIPWDGKAFGEVQVRGPWITGAYYHDADPAKFADGWLRTGDVATVDELGYIGIVDRTKDVIKSGGEWISSVELENLIMGHPQVLEACVIGVPDPKWQERPVAYVVPKPEFRDTLTKEDIIAYLTPLVAKWWLPDDVIFVDSVPKTSVGKFDKKVLRAQHTASHAPSE